MSKKGTTETHMKKLAYENYRIRAAQQSKENDAGSTDGNLDISNELIYISSSERHRASGSNLIEHGSSTGKRRPNLSEAQAPPPTHNSFSFEDHDFATSKHFQGIESSYGKGILFNKEIITTNLEAWWITSPLWRRITLQICIFIVLIGLAHWFSSIAWLYRGIAIEEYELDVHACGTENCLKVAEWVRSAMDPSVNPCDDFYGFVCNKFDDPTLWVPKEMDMLYVKLQYERQETLAKVLRRESSKDKVVTYYKACIDERTRRKQGLKPMINLIQRSGLFSKNSTLEEEAGDLSWIVGDFGFFNYVYFRGRSLQVWVLSDYHKGLAEPEVQPLLSKILETLNKDGDNFIVQFIKEVNPIYGIPIKTGGTISNPSAADYANYISELLGSTGECLAELSLESSKWKTLSKAGYKSQIQADAENIFDFTKTLTDVEGLSSLNVGENYYFGSDELDSPLLEPKDGGLFYVPSCLRIKLMNKFGISKEKITTNTIKLAYISFFWMRIFTSYGKELDPETFFELIPPKSNTTLFFADAHFKKVSLEYQCLDSLAANYGLYFLATLSKEVGAEKVLKGKYHDYETKFMQILRKWLAMGKFSHLSMEEEEAMKKFVDPETYVELKEKHYDTDKLIYLKDWTPDPKEHFANCWKARNLSEYEYAYDWETDDLTLWMSKIGREVLQEIRTEHGILRNDEYQNAHIIYVPIPMVIAPYVNNDMRSMNYAGGGSYIARATIGLIRDHQLASYINSEIVYAKTLERVAQKCQICSSSKCEKCLQSRSNVRCLYNQDSNIYNSALSIKLTFELFQNSRLYGTRVPATNRKLTLEPTYSSTGAVKYYYHYKFSKDGKGNLIKKTKYLINETTYRTNPTKQYTYVYKYIDGLKQFNEQQLFFILLIRNHCYLKNVNYKENVNNILKQVEEFSQVWNCTKHDRMNSVGNKCYS